MALGREGPTVQMDGTAAVIVATLTRRNIADLRILVAGGSRGGIGHRFQRAHRRWGVRPRRARQTVRSTHHGRHPGGVRVRVRRRPAADATGIRLPHQALADPRLIESGWVLAIGLVTGVLGVLYNEAVMRALRRADASRWPKEVRAALTGVLVGLLSGPRRTWPAAATT